MRRETPFSAVDGDLIIIDALVTGPRSTTTGRFVLATGSAVRTMTHELASLIGYSARDGFKITRVHTAIGEEAGYVVRVAELTALHFTRSRFAVNVFDLGHDDIDGLLGMNFLSAFNYEVRSAERRRLVEKIAP
ncbi:MAG TPA: retropepsin-like aspartic protease [Kofleriaceae bacterium]|jgi:predicted aspartyl protease|nr:retropepsin-like aspartic protease [Kofleriaceae bacterium]